MDVRHVRNRVMKRLTPDYRQFFFPVTDYTVGWLPVTTFTTLDCKKIKVIFYLLRLAWHILPLLHIGGYNTDFFLFFILKFIYLLNEHTERWWIKIRVDLFIYFFNFFLIFFENYIYKNITNFLPSIPYDKFFLISKRT